MKGMTRSPLVQRNLCEEAEPGGEFVLCKSQASRGQSGLGWEDGSEAEAVPKCWREVRGLKLENLGQTSQGLASFKVNPRGCPEPWEMQAGGLAQAARLKKALDTCDNYLLGPGLCRLPFSSKWQS